jgi:hypothetical protein
VDLDAVGRLVTKICLDAWEQWGWGGNRPTTEMKKLGRRSSPTRKSITSQRAS